jgi:hypothetical protein
MDGNILVLCVMVSPTDHGLSPDLIWTNKKELGVQDIDWSTVVFEFVLHMVAWTSMGLILLDQPTHINICYLSQHLQP